MDEDSWTYTNRTGRPAGRFLQVASALNRGVRHVQQQIGPYADAWQAANLAALSEPGARWIVLGDSMSQGVGASRFDAGWVNQVNDRLTAEGRGYRLVNLSASGARVADVLDQQLPVVHQLPARADTDPRPDLVTVLIGSNDLIRKEHRKAFAARYRRLLDELPAGAVVATLPNPRQAATEANRLITAAAQAGRIEVAEMRTGRTGSWRGRLADDHFHPNDAGYAALAEVFYDVISSAVAGATTRVDTP